MPPARCAARRVEGVPSVFHARVLLAWGKTRFAARRRPCFAMANGTAVADAPPTGAPLVAAPEEEPPLKAAAAATVAAAVAETEAANAETRRSGSPDVGLC